MQLTINVDETQFKDIIEKELAAFSKEELHDLVKEMIKQYLKEDNVLRSLFITKSHRYGDYYEDAPTDLLRNTVQTIDLSEGCEEIRDSMINVIKNDAKEIVTNLFAKAISRSLFKSWEAEGWLSNVIWTTVREMQQNNQ